MGYHTATIVRLLHLPTITLVRDISVSREEGMNITAFRDVVSLYISLR
jgi:hypothetical protein